MPPARLLIVDDKSTMRSILRTLLAQRLELEVCGEASNGLEAVEKAKALRPDLVLLDVKMPKMNGIEAASILKTQCPDASVILFTMYSENIGKSLSSAVGVDAVLSKPDGLAALLKAIEHVLASKPPS
jgi:DNA-binding NarL/FixJ family response regulator